MTLNELLKKNERENSKRNQRRSGGPRTLGDLIGSSSSSGNNNGRQTAGRSGISGANSASKSSSQQTQEPFQLRMAKQGYQKDQEQFASEFLRQQNSGKNAIDWYTQRDKELADLVAQRNRLAMVDYSDQTRDLADLDTKIKYAEQNLKYAGRLKAQQEYEDAHSLMRSSGLGSERYYNSKADNLKRLEKEYDQAVRKAEAAKAGMSAGNMAGEFAYMFEEDRQAAAAEYERAAADVERIVKELNAAQREEQLAGAFRWEDVSNFEGKAAEGLKEAEQKAAYLRANIAAAHEDGSFISFSEEKELDSLPTNKWTEQEKKTYGYLYARDKEQGTNEAAEYGRRVNNQINAQLKSENIKDITDDSNATMAGRAVVARGANLLSGVDYLNDLLEYGTKGYVMTRPEVSLTDYGRAVDAENARRLNDWSGTLPEEWAVIGGKGAGEAYSILASAIDSGLAIAVGGEVGSLASMGLRSASNAFEDARERGASDGQALTYGLASGAAEVIFEKFSVENLLSKKASKEFIKRFAKQGAIEMSEEMATSFANAISEAAILKDKGELETTIRQYMTDGMSYDEASKKAMTDTAQSILYDGLAGFISGGLMVAGQTLAAGGNQNFVRGIENYEQQQEYEQAIRDAGIGGYENQLSGAMDVLEGKVTPEQQQAKEQKARAKLESMQSEARAEQAQQQAENRREVVSQILSRTAKAQGVELSDSDRATLAGIYNFDENGSSGSNYAQAVIEAFQMGRDGGYTAVNARMASKNGAKLTAEQFTQAFNLGAGVETESTGSSLEASLAALGTHAETAASAIEDGQDETTYSAAMSMAAGYAANGGDVAELAKASEKGSPITTLSEKQIQVAKEIGKQLQAERAAETKKNAEARAKINQQAEAILEQEIPELGEVNSSIKALTDFRAQEQAELEQVRQEMAAILEADPEAKSTEAYQKAQERAETLEKAIENDGKILDQLKESRQEIRSKSQRKKGTVSYDGATIDGKHYEGIDRSKLTKAQQRVVSMVEGLADIINLDYVFFNAPGDFGGAYAGNGVVYININSGMGLRSFSKEIAAASLSHELTHFIQEYAAEEYDALRSFVVDEVMKKSPAEFDRLVRQQMRWEPGISYEGAVNELVANGCMTMLQNTQAVKQLVREHMTLAERMAERISEIGQQLKEAFGTVDVNDNAPIYQAAKLLQESFGEIQTRFDKALAAATENYNAEKTVERATGEKKNASREAGVQNMLIGVRDDGIEVYETSEETKRLPWKEKKQQFLRLLENDYKGRTARFKRNGHTFFATFEDVDAEKNIYGDQESDKSGRDAKINAGADGDVFDLVENAEWFGGEVERGKKGKAHKDVKYWDYFLKTVQIDGKVFDLLANVRRKIGDSFVYNLELYERNDIEAASPSGQSNGKAYSRVPTASNKSIADDTAKSKSQKQTWDSLSQEEQQAEINATMTMQQAKAMVEKAFVAGGIKEWYDGKYRTGDQWLKAEGASEVANIIDNEYELQRKYINSNPHLVEYDYTIEDALDAYLAGTLTGKVKAAGPRGDVSQSRGYKDSRFYAPSFGKADAETWAKANEKASGKNQQEVMAARKNILLAAHAGNLEKILGITIAELNKKLRNWSRYSSNARAVSLRINEGVAPENQWTGIQNSSILSGMSISDEDIRSMVGDITGESSEYQRRNIGNTMLALDTHIDWSWLNFDFKRGPADESRRTVRGFYNNKDRRITVGGQSGQNTVSHEMGHALDYQWERELFGRQTGIEQPLSENALIEKLIVDDDGRTFYRNFRSFIDELTDVNENYSNYTMEPKETFARFVARFVQWTQETAGAYVFKESGVYDDKFTAKHYVQFAKLLQEKAAWDAKRATSGQMQFQRWSETADDTAAEAAGRDLANARLQAENAILTETVAAMQKLTSKQDKTIAALQKRLQITKTPEVRQSDARKLARTLIQEVGSKADAVSIAEQLKELGDYLLQTETGKISEEAIKNRARGIASEILESASEQVGIEEDIARQIGQDIRGQKLSIDEDFLGELDVAGGYEAFRKSLFGRLTLAKREAKTMEGRDGYKTVTQFYDDLQSTYGKAYFPDVANEGEAVQVLAQMLDASQPMEVNPYEQYMGEVTEELANRIVMDAMNGVLRPTAPTTMDKQKARAKALQEQIKQLRDEQKLSQREAASLYHTIYDLSVALDKAESKYQTLQSEARYRTAQVRAEGAARAAEIKAAEREKAAKEISALKEHYREMREQANERREESQGVSKYRRQVEQKAKKLYDQLMTNSDKKHVPQVLKEPLGEFLESLDFSSQRKLAGGEDTQRDIKFGARMQKLQQMLENQQKYINGEGDVKGDLGGYIDVAPDMQEYLREMSERITETMNAGRDFTINNMTAAELRDLSKLLSNLSSTIRNMNELMANARYASVQQAASEDIDRMKELGRVRPQDQNVVSKAVAWQNGTPYYVFKRLGEGAKSIFDAFTRGWEKMAFNAQEIINFTEKAYTDQEVKDWKKQVHDITLSDGSKIKMTTPQIMAFAASLGREQAMKHISKGGVRIGDIEGKRGGKITDTKHYHLTDEDIGKIVGLLSERQSKVAEELQHFMAVKGAEWGNEVTMRRFGYNFYEEGDSYFPIKTDSNDRPMADTDAQQNSMFRLLNLSSSKSLNPKASNALVIEDIFDVFANHMADMAKLNGMGLPILDAIKWFNYKERVDLGDGQYDTRTLQGAMEEAFGTQAQQYFRTLMKDINGVTEAGDRGTGLLSKFMSNYKAAAVGGNLRVALLQPTSYVRASFLVKPKYLMAAFASKNAYKEAMENSGTAVWKSMGYYDTNISRSMREQITHNDSVKDKIVEAAMKLAEIGDQLTWGRLWVACKMQTKAENKNLSGQALIDKTNDLFRETIYATQVMDSTLTRSEIMRGKTVASKAMTAFMAEPTLSFNLLMDSFSNLSLDSRRFGKDKAWKLNANKIGKAFAVYAASAAFAAVVESMADALRDDDNDEYWLKFLRALFDEGVVARMRGEKTTESLLKSVMSGNLAQDLTILGKLPYVKAIISTLQGYESKDMTTEAFTNIINAVKVWDETIKLNTGALDKATKTTYYGNMTEWGKIYKSLQALSQISGIPAANALRDVFSIWNATVGEQRPDWKIKTYRSKSERTYLEELLPTGVTWEDYQKAISSMDADESGSINQDEAGPYIAAELSAGRLTQEQAEALWNATTSGSTSFQGWQEKAEKAAAKEAEEQATFEQYVASTGISSEQYEQIMTEANADGNNSVTQNELGQYLVEGIENGTITEEQAQGLWKSLWNKANSKTFDKWRAANGSVMPEATQAPVTDFDSFKSTVPVYSDKVEEAYHKWEENVQPLGIDLERYTDYLVQADTDGNGSVKQDEMGAVLKEAVDHGDLSMEQASAIWCTLWKGTGRSKSFEKWLASQEKG